MDKGGKGDKGDKGGKVWTCWVRTKVDWVVEAAEALLGQTSMLAPSGKQNGGTCQETEIRKQLRYKNKL